MYDASDPRSKLSAGAAQKHAATEFAAADYAKFSETAPQEEDRNGRSWYTRGQNFVVAYTEAKAGAVFSRTGQPDEYVVLLPDHGTSVAIATPEGKQTVPSYSIAFVPPGDSTVTVTAAGRLIRLFTVQSADLMAKASNAASYAKPQPNIPPYAPWPAPKGGFRVRVYTLDVPEDPSRFGRIWRCSTFMVNYLAPQAGPRDVTKLSPHFHDDFQQCSLALEGAFVHHLRWPWTTNMHNWREDQHEFCGSPSVAIIPPPAIHTSRAMEAGINQLVDIFCPPRTDFSLKPGWVLNADEYPMPQQG